MYLHSKLSLSIAVFCIFSKAVSRTSDPPPAFDKYLITFDHIPSPNFGITNCIIRDARGFLWFGTNKGLCKYDGYQVRVFPNGMPLDHPQQVVTAMINMNGDSLLLATGKGLWTFDLKTEQFAPFLVGSESFEHRITAMLQDQDSTLWIGTASEGLFRYDRTTTAVRRYTLSNGLSDDRITSLLIDGSGKLWIGTLGGGLNVLDLSSSRFSAFRADASSRTALLSDNVTSLGESGDHVLWIGTGWGLNVLDSTRTHMRQLDIPSDIRHTVRAIVSDPGGRMWIGVADFGLLTYVNGAMTQFPESDKITRSMSAIRALYLDPVASTATNLLLWIGTRYGVMKVFMSTNPFTNRIRNQDSLYIDRGAVLSLCEDRKGILWIGLWGGGLEGLRQADGKYRRIAHFDNDPKDPRSLPNNDVQAIVEDRNGNLLIGTNNGLAVLDPDRKHFTIDRHVEDDSTSLVTNDVSGLFEDRSGRLWIYGRGGLSKMLPGSPHRFRNYLHGPEHVHPLFGNVISNIIEDRQSRLWASTFGFGLYRLEPDGSFTRFAHPADTTGSEENFIYTGVEDSEGMFWLSTSAGLVSFDPHSATFRRYEIEQLHNAHIFGIVPDENHDLWLSTGIGLVKFNPGKNTFVRYDEKDGMPFNEFFSDFFRNSRGNLLVGGLDGFTEFSPQRVAKTSPPPEIVITSFSVLGKEVSSALTAHGEIRLTYDQNFFSFSFAALDYSNPLRNSFAYKMTGVDENWIDAGTRNYVSYTHLDPGSYVFQVKGCNSDNVWNETGTSIPIIITPPYWQTWWFRILLAVFAGAVIYTAYRYRLQKLLEVERLRLRIADDLHDDIGSNLSSIAMISRVASRMPELTTATKQKLAEIYDTAVTTSEGMKDIVWFIKPKNDTIEDLVLRMKDTASTLLADVSHEFQVVPGSSQRISLDFKKNHFLAFKEILTNIVKHSSATRVSIRVELKDGMLETVVRDDGKGFDPAAAARGTRGHGLTSLQNRAAAIGGVCEIRSESGTGTTVRFSGRT